VEYELISVPHFCVRDSFVRGSVIAPNIKYKVSLPTYLGT
jgi:hypothetical protein